jgi:hypothetical protein
MRDSVRLTVGQAMVRFLAAQWTERDGVEQRLFEGCFGIFGHGNVGGIGQALLENEVAHPHRPGQPLPDETLPYLQARNEQAMVHASAAYARMRNRLTTLACTASIGPGSTNMVTGAALATVNRLPVLLLPSDVYATRVANPVLQELEDPRSYDVTVNDAFRPISRFFDRVWRPAPPAARRGRGGGGVRGGAAPARTAPYHKWPESSESPSERLQAAAVRSLAAYLAALDGIADRAAAGRADQRSQCAGAARSDEVAEHCADPGADHETDRPVAATAVIAAIAAAIDAVPMGERIGIVGRRAIFPIDVAAVPGVAAKRRAGGQGNGCQGGSKDGGTHDLSLLLPVGGHAFNAQAPAMVAPGERIALRSARSAAPMRVSLRMPRF